MEITRKLLGGKIHRATVTESNLEYEGSITLPHSLMQAAGIMPYEAVHVWNVSSGNRFETYAITGGQDDGHICVNGAAAHLTKPGDLVIIAHFVWLDEKACKNFEPKIVLVDAQNRIKLVKNKESNLPTAPVTYVNQA